jgi:hypothetical protein
MVRRLLGGGLVSVGMLAMALPAHAGSATVTDPSNDTLDPFLTQNNATVFHTPAPSADITSYTLASTTLNGKPALQATISVAGTIPALTDPVTAYSGPSAPAAVGEYPGFVGGSYYVMYADTRTEKNTYAIVGCSQLATGDPVYNFQEHWQDGYRDYIGVDVTYDGTGWKYTPTLGYYDPTATGGFGFIDFTGDDAFPSANYSVVRTSANTIQVTAVTQVTTTDPTCGSGIYTYDQGKPGDTLASITGFTTTDQVVILPVAIPTGATGLIGDTQAIGGLIYTEDWANQAGYDLGTAGPYSFVGPTCATPTFGGKLPRNPLFVDGQPCNIINPAGGGGFRNSGTSMVY